MKSFLITLISLIFIFNASNAQQLKKKTQTLGNFKETYYVDKKTGMNEGTYLLLFKGSNDTIAQGQFTNGKRHGTWKYHDSNTGNKILEYNYNNDSLLFYEKKFYPNSYMINTGNGFNHAIVDRPLIFIGYQNELLYNIAENIKIPVKAKKNREAGFSILCYFVDEYGKIAGSKIIETFDTTSEQQINKFVNDFNGRLLPAIHNGKPVKSMFYLKINWNSFLSFTYVEPFIYEINMSVQMNYGNPAMINSNYNHQINGPLERQFYYQDIGNQLR